MTVKPSTIFWAYLAIAIFTFGHSAAGNASYSVNPERSGTALFAGIFWPLYWSWEFQK